MFAVKTGDLASGFTMPFDLLDQTYRSRYALHFYSRSELDGFVNRWR